MKFKSGNKSIVVKEFIVRIRIKIQTLERKGKIEKDRERGREGERAMHSTQIVDSNKNY